MELFGLLVKEVGQGLVCFLQVIRCSSAESGSTLEAGSTGDTQVLAALNITTAVATIEGRGPAVTTTAEIGRRGVLSTVASCAGSVSAATTGASARAATARFCHPVDRATGIGKGRSDFKVCLVIQVSGILIQTVNRGTAHTEAVTPVDVLS